MQLIRKQGHREPALTPRFVPFTKGGCLMRRRLLSAAPMVVAALVVVGLVLALGACGAGGQEKAKARSLPLYPTENALHPGEYHSVTFKPPLSFKVGKGWINSGPEGGGQREVERLVGAFRAYSPKCVE